MIGEDIMDINEFGVFESENQTSGKTEDYETKYMKDIHENSHITGELNISTIKDSDYGERFFIWITNHEKEEQWGIQIQNPYIIEEEGITKIYAKEGRLYKFLDSFFREILGNEYKNQNSYTFDFEKFRETINNKIESITVQAVPSEHLKAKYPDFKVIDVVKLDDSD